MMLQLSRQFLFVCVGLLLAQNVFATTRSLAIIGDAGRAGRALDNLRQSVLAEKIDSIIMPGDNLYSGTYPAVWNSWKKDGLKFDLVAIGNHNGGYANEVAYFGMPSEFYTIQKNGARFIILNSDNTKNVAEQFAWLEKVMAQATEKLIFLVYHHPTYTVTRSHSWQEKSAFQIRMRVFLKENGSRISGLLLGHDHITSFLEFGGVPVVIAGSGREVRNEKAVSYTEGGVRIETRYLAPRTQHWAVLEIPEGAQEAVIRFVRVSDNKTVCSALFKEAAMKLSRICAP